MLKTSAMFQNNRWKTVRGVAPTRYPLSIHFDSISYRIKTKLTKEEKARNTYRRIISKPNAHLHSMQKTSVKFQNILWKTVRGVERPQGTHCLYTSIAFRNTKKKKKKKKSSISKYQKKKKKKKSKFTSRKSEKK